MLRNLSPFQKIFQTSPNHGGQRLAQIYQSSVKIVARPTFIYLVHSESFKDGGYVMIFWTVIFVLVINYMYKKNTIYTQRIAHSEREGALRNQANALMGRANDLQRKLDLKKRQAAAAVGLK